MITIINYEMGNLFSVESSFNYLGYKTDITDSNEKIVNSKIIIMPGVGSFKKAMKIIKSKKIDLSINECLRKGSKILGICLGMQLLTESSNEDGFSFGLGLIKNKVEKFNTNEVKGMKIPHIGFNSITYQKNDLLFKNLKRNPDFYFVHSYRIDLNKFSDDKVFYSEFNYGNNFVSSFASKNICGTQFHPEKSQTNGLILLKNFIES